MRIKLSKQNWRLVGQKMGWLKRAQITTDYAAGVKNTGAAESIGVRMGQPQAMESIDEFNNKGNVDDGIDDNIKEDFMSQNKNISLHQGLLTDVQFELLSDIDHGIQVLFQTTDPKFWNINNGIIAEKYFGSIKGTTDLTGYNSGPITVESFEDALKTWWNIDSKIKRGLSHNSQNISPRDQGIINNKYTEAQLRRFEKAVAERRQKLESTKALVRNAFRTHMAGKPQLENTEGLNLDFTGNVKL